MLTPRIVRVLDLTEDDLRAFQMGRDPGSAGATGAAARRLGVPPASSSFRCPTSHRRHDRPRRSA